MSPLRSYPVLIKPLLKSDHLGWPGSRPIRLQTNRTWRILVCRELGWNGTSVVNSNWSGLIRDPIRRRSELFKSLIEVFRKWMEVIWCEWRPNQSWFYLVGHPIKLIGLECRPDQIDLKRVEIRSKSDPSGLETRSKVIGPEWRPDHNWLYLSHDVIRGDRTQLADWTELTELTELTEPIELTDITELTEPSDLSELNELAESTKVIELYELVSSFQLTKAPVSLLCCSKYFKKRSFPYQAENLITRFHFTNKARDHRKVFPKTFPWSHGLLVKWHPVIGMLAWEGKLWFSDLVWPPH